MTSNKLIIAAAASIALQAQKALAIEARTANMFARGRV